VSPDQHLGYTASLATVDHLDYMQCLSPLRTSADVGLVLVNGETIRLAAVQIACGLFFGQNKNSRYAINTPAG